MPAEHGLPTVICVSRMIEGHWGHQVTKYTLLLLVWKSWLFLAATMEVVLLYIYNKKAHCRIYGQYSGVIY